LRKIAGGRRLANNTTIVAQRALLKKDYERADFQKILVEKRYPTTDEHDFACVAQRALQTQD